MLRAENIHKTYKGGVHALKGVTINIPAGSAIGLIGESGCGKSTLAHIICMLEYADKGTLTLEGNDYTANPRSARKQIQIIFQDSAGSLDPRRTVFQSIKEPLTNYFKLTKADLHGRVCALMSDVGLDLAHLNKYPHQLSGGERQRVVIARALALSPEYIICDEPVSSLDSDIAAQILELLKTLQNTRRIGYLFISHDIGLTVRICKEVHIMQEGTLVDSFDTQNINIKDRHPYTRLLLSFSGEGF